MDTTAHLMMSRTDYGWRWNLLTAQGCDNGLAPSVEQAAYDALDRSSGCLAGLRIVLDQALAGQARAALNQRFGVEVCHPAFSIGVEGPLIVATDGSAKGSALGWGWAAANGQTGSGGATMPRRTVGVDAPLMAELRGIEAAIRALPGRRLHLLVDSRAARCLVQRWLDGSQESPCKALSDLMDVVHSQRRRLEVEWVRAHQGNVLNERADLLARQGRTSSTARTAAPAA